MIAALALAAALDVTPPSPKAGGPCADATMAAAVRTAAAALKTDRAEAKAAIAPAAACPVRSGATFAAHVLRAELAVAEEDWATAHTLLAGLGVHPEATISGRAGFLRLRADQGVKDPTAFARDRADLLAADDAVLTRLGHKRESFRAGAARVDVYDAQLAQDGFQRVYEFIATPDDPAAYPMSVLVTDDRTAVSLGKTLAKPGETKPDHAWFFDLYTCANHATLPPPARMFGAAPPSYEEAKAAALKALSEEGSATAPPEKAACFTYLWLLPGLGAHAPVS